MDNELNVEKFKEALKGNNSSETENSSDADMHNDDEGKDVQAESYVDEADVKKDDSADSKSSITKLEQKLEEMAANQQKLLETIAMLQQSPKASEEPKVTEEEQFKIDFGDDEEFISDSVKTAFQKMAAEIQKLKSEKEETTKQQTESQRAKQLDNLIEKQFSTIKDDELFGAGSLEDVKDNETLMNNRLKVAGLMLSIMNSNSNIKPEDAFQKAYKAEFGDMLEKRKEKANAEKIKKLNITPRESGINFKNEDGKVSYSKGFQGTVQRSAEAIAKLLGKGK